MTVGVALLEDIDEVAFFSVPPLVMSLPEDVRQGWAWWVLIEAMKAQTNVIMIGPPQDVEYVFSDDPAQIRQVTLRHDCDTCTASVEEAARWVENNASPVCLVQCNQQYMRSPGQPSPFGTAAGRTIRFEDGQQTEWRR